MHSGAQAASGTPTDQGPLHRRESKGRRAPLLGDASQHSVILPPPLLGHMVLGPPGRNPGPPVPMPSWSIAPACSPAKPIHALILPHWIIFSLCVSFSISPLSLSSFFIGPVHHSLSSAQSKVYRPVPAQQGGSSLFPRLTLAPALWLV